MADRSAEGLIDLSHVIEEGMTTYKGLPGPHICDFWSREDSAANYDDGSSFQIGRIDLVANTGTYVDSPFHRYAEGKDLSELPLESLANLDGIVVRRPFENGLAVEQPALLLRAQPVLNVLVVEDLAERSASLVLTDDVARHVLFGGSP